ncbi:unannotated protein [freshwater metagenome]|jgi:hypothetical protein|uniref:Unannotated protein n=1 Tax=freshwater metagenome TaxID=449393 RepID=A0A6J6I6K8_9ZZZZ|nr:hypothetical protein [Actinomycetota bacterium]MSZ23535.1 hypothetical protein [Actinomycetota bacterium]MSZ92836.1 hypothetical protein [Actinomycetota bacterium]
MHTLQVIAGISFDPGIRGILVVLVGVTVLMGSVYLLLGTNLGSRLGFLVALTGLFGWLAILTFMWWLTPPAIGPRGNLPTWKPVEIYVNGGGDQAKIDALSGLIDPASLPKADKILAENPDLAKDFPNGFTLSDLQTNHPAVVSEYLDAESLNGWKLVSAANAGEAQAAADVELVASGVFKTTADYKKLNTWQFGGKPTLEDDCPDGGIVCRVWHRISSAFQIKNPKNYSVVQVQQVIPQETIPGQAPPIPKADPTKPVISVVFVRDIGNERVIPFLYFVICMSLFIVSAWALHNRDKTLMKNKAMAEAASKES